MALQIYTQDRAGDYVLAGAQGLGGGIAAGGEGVGSALAQRRERLNKDVERQRKEADEAKRLRAALGAAFPNRKSEFEVMSRPQLQGEYDNIALQRTMQIIQQGKQEQTGQEKFNTILGNIIQPQPGSQGIGVPVAGRGRPLTPEDIIAAATRSGTGTPEMVSRMLLEQQALRQREQSPENLAFGEDPITGTRFAQYGRSILPSGINPQKFATGSAIEILDDQGQPTGNLGVWTGRGVQVIKKPKEATGEMKPAYDPEGNIIPGVYVDANGKVHDLRSQIQKVRGVQTEPSAPRKLNPKDPLALFE
jgi:hypothetical protein